MSHQPSCCANVQPCPCKEKLKECLEGFIPALINFIGCRVGCSRGDGALDATILLSTERTKNHAALNTEIGRQQTTNVPGTPERAMCRVGTGVGVHKVK